ncbi:MAG: hypothetical protein VKJ24_18610 [Synechococcales bacterium]|nr:hypothetical protein [Synechococcales bacterium]
MGQVAGGRAWNFVVLLYAVMMITGLSTGLSQGRSPDQKSSDQKSPIQKSPIQKGCYRVSALGAGALLGFGGAGRWLTFLLRPWLEEKQLLKLSLHPQIAIAGAVLCGLLMLGLAGSSHRASQPESATNQEPQMAAIVSICQHVVWVAQVITTYGSAFLLGVSGLNFLSIQQWIPGLCLTTMAGVLLIFTSRLLLRSVQP